MLYSSAFGIAAILFSLVSYTLSDFGKGLVFKINAKR